MPGAEGRGVRTLPTGITPEGRAVTTDIVALLRDHALARAHRTIGLPAVSTRHIRADSTRWRRLEPRSTGRPGHERTVRSRAAPSYFSLSNPPCGVPPLCSSYARRVAGCRPQDLPGDALAGRGGDGPAQECPGGTSAAAGRISRRSPSTAAT